MVSVIKIIIPNISVPEVSYTFNCLFSEFLGLEIEFVVDPLITNFKVTYENKIIEISNLFFVTDDVSLLYNKKNLPVDVDTNVVTINNKKFPLVSLYGRSVITTNQDFFFIHSDVIASTFFMLTRWEESIIQEYDFHERFNSNFATAVKFQFIQRPIVNEYVEILWELLRNIGYDRGRIIRQYNLVPTHDVDLPYSWYGFKDLLIKTLKLFYRRKIQLALQNIGRYVKGIDLFDNHDYFMDMADKAGVKSYFFFMSGGNSKFDNYYNIKNVKVKELIHKIQNRGHEVGLHPSYNSFNNPILFADEKKHLVSVSSSQVVTGRQHSLRFKVPDTWILWDRNDMEWDSSMTYAAIAGFRCGVCYSFPVYDFLNRKKLGLRERPLILMETSIIVYEKLNHQECLNKIIALKNQVKKYNGDFVFLWHNTSFNVPPYSRATELLEYIYD